MGKSNSGKASNTRIELAQIFQDALEQQQMPWSACWQTPRPGNAITEKPYRGVNRLRLAVAAAVKGYDDPRWCTFRQAEKKGWKIRKGEKATQIEYWGYYDSRQKQWINWDEANAIVKDEGDDAEAHLWLRCKTHAVFNAAQIDGIPELEKQPGLDIGSIRNQRDTLLHNMGLQFMDGADGCYYRPSTDTVLMPHERDFVSAYAYMASFLHECGHATGHPARLNRATLESNTKEDRAREELRAEIASAFTAQELGITEGLEAEQKNHIAYIQSWAKILADAPTELFCAIRDAEAICDYLMEKGEFRQQEKAKVQEGLWYAICLGPADGDWSVGAESWDEAVKMAEPILARGEQVRIVTVEGGREHGSVIAERNLTMTDVRHIHAPEEEDLAMAR